jgi:transposase
LVELPKEEKRQGQSAMRRRNLSEEQWAIVAPLLPPQPKVGRKRQDDRRTLNGILYVLRSGCAWADLPPEYGAATTCWRWFERWSADGTWEQIWQTLLSQLDGQQKLEWAQAFLDGSFVPAKRGATV